jgi:antitoxin component YwqK of YwqJK toxin-antitoxin module
MKAKLIIAFSLLFSLNSFSQEITFVKDEILDNYKESGFLASNFIPVGEIDAKYDNQGFWKDYKKTKDFTFVPNNGRPIQINGNFLIYEEGIYSNSERIGKWLHYTIEDKTFKKILQKEDNYIDGFLDGEFKYFFPNENIALKGNYDRKNQEYTIKLYYLYGEIYGDELYKNNLKTGTQTYFYPDGAIMEKIKYDKGKKNGIQQFYHKNGQLWTERTYKNDLLLNVKGNYSENGKPRDKGTIKDGNGTVKYYNEEGKVYQIITFKKGLEINKKKL